MHRHTAEKAAASGCAAPPPTAIVYFAAVWQRKLRLKVKIESGSSYGRIKR